MQRRFCAGLVLLVLLQSGPACAEELISVEPTDPYRDSMKALAEGRIHDARAALALLVANEPDSAGAWLDLATLHCSLGDAAEAERLFVEIEKRFSPPPEILEIINQQRAQGCVERWQRAPARPVVRLGRGYDSNANQGVSNPNFSIGSGSSAVDLVILPAYRRVGDQFSTLSVDYLNVIPFFDNTQGLLQFRGRKYDQLSKVDSESFLASVDRAVDFMDWRLRGGATAVITTLRGSPYLNQGQLLVQAEPPLRLPPGWQFTLAGGWSYFFYPSFQAFNGNVFEIRSSLGFHKDAGGWQASAGAMRDQQVNRRPGGDRRGYFASIDGHYLLPQGMLAELGWQHQRWQAQDDYSPGLIDLHREQNTQVLRAAINIPITTNHSIVAEYQRIDNSENISFLEYKQNVIQISWQFRMGP